MRQGLILFVCAVVSFPILGEVASLATLDVAVTGLIEDLGDRDYQTREKASKLLVRLPPELTIDKIRQATQDTDAERVRRASDILNYIEPRLQWAYLNKACSNNLENLPETKAIVDTVRKWTKLTDKEKWDIDTSYRGVQLVDVKLQSCSRGEMCGAAPIPPTNKELNEGAKYRNEQVSTWFQWMQVKLFEKKAKDEGKMVSLIEENEDYPTSDGKSVSFLEKRTLTVSTKAREFQIVLKTPGQILFRFANHSLKRNGIPVKVDPKTWVARYGLLQSWVAWGIFPYMTDLRMKDLKFPELSVVIDSIDVDNYYGTYQVNFSQSDGATNRSLQLCDGYFGKDFLRANPGLIRGTIPYEYMKAGTL